jgi:pyruvate kinase
MENTTIIFKECGSSGTFRREGMMRLRKNKTKIVCTIGPASDSPSVMEQMIQGGMNVARINFAHGGFTSHQKVIENLRAAARVAGRRVAIIADLPATAILLWSSASL